MVRKKKPVKKTKTPLYKAVYTVMIEKDLTFAVVGERMGVSASSVVMTLDRGRPKMETLQRIADAIGINVKKLVPHCEAVTITQTPTKKKARK